MPSENFKASMMKLCNPQVKVLKKQINKPSFDNPQEKITLNLEYKAPNIRNNLIPAKTLKKKDPALNAEEIKMQKQVAKERQFVIQAHAVKVMKANKQHKYQVLLTDVIRNITMFKADPKMIKEQIEVLIRDSYMERKEDDRTMLVYLP